MSGLKAVLALALAAAAPAPEVKMEAVGRTCLFDYGQMVIRVKYVSADALTWEQVKGPQAGLKGQEKQVHTAWISPHKELAAFQGTIVPEPPGERP